MPRCRRRRNRHRGGRGWGASPGRKAYALGASGRRAPARLPRDGRQPARRDRPSMVPLGGAGQAGAPTCHSSLGARLHPPAAMQRAHDHLPRQQQPRQFLPRPQEQGRLQVARHPPRQPQPVVVLATQLIQWRIGMGRSWARACPSAPSVAIGAPPRPQNEHLDDAHRPRARRLARFSLLPPRLDPGPEAHPPFAHP
jgi:hypothetical protein